MRSALSFLIRLLLILGLLLVAGVWLKQAGILKTPDHDDPDAKPAQDSRYTTAEIGPGTLHLSIQANGRIQLKDQRPVFSEISGRIRELRVDRVDYGRPIEQGQVLALIDDREYQSAVEELTADLASAQADRQAIQAKLNHAESEARRQQRLFREGLIPQVDADNASALARELEAQLAAAGARVQRSESRLSQARADLEKAEVTSPIDGVLIGIEVDPGDVVNALTKPLFHVAPNFDDLIIEAEVDESDIGKVHTGQTATFEVDAHPGELFNAEVRSVSPGGREERGVVIYDVELAAQNPDDRLRRDMTARVTIEAEDRDVDALLPISALLYSPDDVALKRSEDAIEAIRNRGDTLIWLLKDGKPQPGGVALGAQDDEFVEILGEWDTASTTVITSD